MNSKIAKVKVLANGASKTLSEWDSKRPGLAGGHLVAQLARFESLWRVHVVIERRIWAKMSSDLRDCLKKAVNVCVLQKVDEDRTIEQAVRQDVIKPLMLTAGSPYFEHSLLDEPRIAASHGEGPGGNVELAYPTGAPQLSAFFPE